MTDTMTKPVSTGLAVTFDTKILKREFARVKPALRTGNLPILSGVKIDADQLGVSLTCTDLSFGLSTRITDGCEVEVGGSVIISGAMFGKLLAKAGPSITITFVPGSDQCSIDTTRAIVDLRTMPLDEYPRLPCMDGTDAPDETFEVDVDAIADVLTAACRDQARPILNGVLLDGSAVVATDSYRLHIFETGQPTSKHKQILPLDFCTAVAKWGVGRYPAAIYDNNIRTDIDNLTVFARIVAGEFPNYKALVTNGGELLLVNRPSFDKVLADVVDTATALGVAGEAPLLIASGKIGTLELSLTVQDVATVRRSVPGTFVNGLDRIGFNPRYLNELLVGTEASAFQGVDALKPFQIHDDLGDGRSRTRVIMPVRIA